MLAFEHPEDSPGCTRSVRLSQLEISGGEPNPRLGRIVLQCYGLAEQLKRLAVLRQSNARVACVDVSQNVLGLDPHGPCQGLERLAWAPVAQERGAQVIEHVGVIRVPREVEPEVLQCARGVSERCVRMA